MPYDRGEDCGLWELTGSGGMSDVAGFKWADRCLEKNQELCRGETVRGIWI